MNKKTLEKEILDLPPSERREVALVAWESLFNDTDFVANPNFDPAGNDLAFMRDAEIESGHVKPINHSEFQKNTSQNSE